MKPSHVLLAIVVQVVAIEALSVRMNLTVSRGKKRIKSQGRQDGPGTTSFRQNFRDWQPPYDPFVNVHEAVISHHQPSSTGPDYQQEINECAVGRSLETMCLPLTECAVWYDLLTNSAHDKACKMDKGGLGACCPDIPLNGRGRPFRPVRVEARVYQQIDAPSISAAYRVGQYTVRVTGLMERLMRGNNITVRLRSAHHNHLLFHQTRSAARTVGQTAVLCAETTRELARRYELTPVQAAFGLSHIDNRSPLGAMLNGTCPADPVCDGQTASSPFRTINGSCNNLRNTSWGMAGTTVQRALAPAYADGVRAPRRAASGRELPGARSISLEISPDLDMPSPTETVWVMQYGQFVDHDIVSTPVFQMADGSDIECCTANEQHINDTDFRHPECFPIDIPEDDPFFGSFRVRCMSFVRSLPAPSSGCRLGYAEQMNQVTHFHDGSQIYGSSDNDARMLRSLTGGKLIEQNRLRGPHELPLLPADNSTRVNCSSMRDSQFASPPSTVQCFKAGDGRVNQLPDLVVAHTVFMREHNRLTDELAQCNPHWDDERLYQEARRIVVAQMQHITYNEWLPIIIGVEKAQEMGLLPLNDGFSHDYDESLNPSIVNEFSTAAFRFGHSLIQGQRHLVNKKRQVEHSILLRNHFFKTGILYTPGNLDKFLIGLATQPMQQFDNWFSEEVTNHLYQEEGRQWGKDLVSLNIQRGRDHGLQGYNAYRQLCGLPRARSFRDLEDVIPGPLVGVLEMLYESVDDIDLFIGSVSERPVPGAVVGPTVRCIVAEQFLRFRRGDRYFYDLEGQPGSFTPEQLNEIRKTSFARILCDNSGIESIQPLAFKIPSDLNPIVECDSPSIPRMNLKAWRESTH